MVFENIEYEHLKQHGGIGMRERLDEVADIIIETLCSTKATINIAGEDYPAQLVKDKMRKINSSHIEELVRVLRVTSNSLNQLTKRVHETGSIYSEDIEDLRKSYDRLWSAAEEIMLRLAAI